jgi:hypothetical protein
MSHYDLKNDGINSKSYYIYINLLESDKEKLLRRFSLNKDEFGNVEIDLLNGVNHKMVLSIRPNKEIHYSAIMGTDTCHGTFLFRNKIPKLIKIIIEKVLDEK